MSKQIIGHSAEIVRVRNSLDSIASSSSPVTVTGEIGTGKHFISSMIHSRDKSRTGELVEFNCFTTPERLHEEKLFGYVDAKGNVSEGAIEQAENGTLLLEHIESLSAEAQATILGVLLYGKYYVKNGNEEVPANLRIIATTDREIYEVEEKESLSPNLLKELSTMHLHLPPLRERKEDIPLLIDHFVETEGGKLGKEINVIATGVVEKLLRGSWLGNVSELKSTVHSALVMTSSDVLDVGQLPDVAIAPQSDIGITLYQRMKDKAQSLREFRYEIEEMVLTLALQDEKYNAFRVAKNIGLSEAGMRRAMKRLGIPTKRERKKQVGGEL